MSNADVLAEQVVIGSILVGDDTLCDDAAQTTMMQCMDLVALDDFVDEHARNVWDVLIYMQQKHIPISLTTTISEIERRGMLEECGGKQYLIECMNHVVTSSQAPQYAKIVSDRAFERRIIAAADQIKAMACTRTGADKKPAEASEIGEQAAKIILDETIRKNAHNILHIRDGHSVFMQDLASLQAGRQEIVGSKTGVLDIDRKLNGLRPGQVCVLAARPSVGKTAMAMQWAMSMADHGETVFFFSIEMSYDELRRRAVSYHSQVNLSSMFSGRMSSDQLEQVRKASEDFKRFEIGIEDTPALTTVGLMSRVAKIKAVKPSLRGIFIDYLQLMRLPDGNNGKRIYSTNDVITEISRAVKIIARQYGIWVVLLSQLSRAVEKEKREPVLSDLRESGSIEQDADIVIFLHRQPDQIGKRLAEVSANICKNRNGELGQAKLLFDGSVQTFRSMA